MRNIIGDVVTVVILMLAWSPASAMDGYEGLPDTFSECVAAQGDIRRIGDDLTCRLVRASEFRVYGTGKTTCGDEGDGGDPGRNPHGGHDLRVRPRTHDEVFSPQ